MLISAVICLRNGCLRTGWVNVEDIHVIVGYKKPKTERIVFLYAFSKSTKANITTKEEAALSLVAENFVLTTDAELQKLMGNGSIWGVKSYE